MTTNTKLYGKDLSAYDDVDVDTLLSQLSPEEINILAKEVDPDVSTVFKCHLQPELFCTKYVS
jgi:Tropomodulin.